MKHAWSGNRTPTGRVTSGGANHYTTAPLWLTQCIDSAMQFWLNILATVGTTCVPLHWDDQFNVSCLKQRVSWNHRGMHACSTTSAARIEKSTEIVWKIFTWMRTQKHLQILAIGYMHGAKTINVFRACLGAQLTICAQKWRNFVLFSTASFRFVSSRVCVFLYSLSPLCRFYEQACLVLRTYLHQCIYIKNHTITYTHVWAGRDLPSTSSSQSGTLAKEPWSRSGSIGGIGVAGVASVLSSDIYLPEILWGGGGDASYSWSWVIVWDELRGPATTETHRGTYNYKLERHTRPLKHRDRLDTWRSTLEERPMTCGSTGRAPT